MRPIGHPILSHQRLVQLALFVPGPCSTQTGCTTTRAQFFENRHWANDIGRTRASYNSHELYEGRARPKNMYDKQVRYWAIDFVAPGPRTIHMSCARACLDPNKLHEKQGATHWATNLVAPEPRTMHMGCVSALLDPKELGDKARHNH